MSHPYQHAVSSSKRWGGKPEDYMPLHQWFDETKCHFADARHRALRHHSEGIFQAESVFGYTVKNSEGKEIPTRVLGEQHVKEDLGWIPTLADWLREMNLKRWMTDVPGEKGYCDKTGAGSVDLGKGMCPPLAPTGKNGLVKRIEKRFQIKLGEGGEIAATPDGGGDAETAGEGA